MSFSITDYGDKLSRQINQVTGILDDLKIPFRAHLPEWWTDSGRIINIERSEEELKDLFKNCCGKNLFTLTDNKLYRCPFAANADRLNGIPKDERNYVDINESIEKIVDYIGDIDWNGFDSIKNWYAKIKSRPAFRSLLTDYLPTFMPSKHYADLDF